MRCPFCHFEDSKVIDKRETGDKQEITRRRRECHKCGKRFTTYEAVEDVNLVIVKKDGRRERFDKNKVISGLMKACEKRSISREEIENIANKIEIKLRAMDAKEIDSDMIGGEVMKQLKLIDKVAFIRFASVYREFADVDSFMGELKKLLKS